MMGIYDIIDYIKVYCPKCGKIITNQFQTKDIDWPGLNHYKPGDIISKNRKYKNQMEIHTICEECKLFFGIYIKIKNNKLTDELC